MTFITFFSTIKQVLKKCYDSKSCTGSLSIGLATGDGEPKGTDRFRLANWKQNHQKHKKWKKNQYFNA